MNIYVTLTEDGRQYIEYDILIRNVLKIFTYIFFVKENFGRKNEIAEHNM